MTLAPQFLKKGDKVILLSTARKMSVEDIQTAKSLIESWGLQVELGETIGAEHHQYAGNDALRLKDFQRAIDNDNIRAIFCARGGYGTVRFLDQIDFSKFLRSPKWLVGFSDVTYLHTLINHQLGIQTLHASMPSLFSRTEDAAIQDIGKILFGEEINYTIPAHPLNRGTEMIGETIGGNLSILYSITGTKSGFDTNGKILFIEDLDEQLYHIDRMMINLKRSGKLDHLAGLLVGGFSAMHDNEVHFGKNAEEIILEHVADKNYPVCFNFPAGHIRENYPLILGRKTTIQIPHAG